MFHGRTRLSLVIVGSILLTSCESRSKPADEEEWIALFNGQDLEDWIPKIRRHPVGVNYLNTFRVEDGLFTVSYDGYDEFNEQFGHIFYKDPFSHYRLRVEYRFIGEQASNAPVWALRNSGVMVHSQDPETMPPDQDFPISLEIQFLGGLSDGKARPTGNMCSPGTHIEYQGEFNDTHCINSTSPTFDGDQWVLAAGAGTWRRENRALHQRPGRDRIRKYDLRWRRGVRTSAGDEARRPAAGRRVHLVAKRGSPDSVPARGTPQSKRLHGYASQQLQTLFCRRRSGKLPLLISAICLIGQT